MRFLLEMILMIQTKKLLNEEIKNFIKIYKRYKSKEFI